MNRVKRMNLVVLAGSILVIGGFFSSWIGFELGQFSGFRLALEASRFGPQYSAAFLLPIMALVSALLSLKYKRISAGVATFTGAAAISWGVFEAARFLYNITFAGLWLTLVGCMVLFAGGLVTGQWTRTKEVVEAELEAEIAADEAEEAAEAAEAADAAEAASE